MESKLILKVLEDEEVAIIYEIVRLEEAHKDRIKFLEDRINSIKAIRNTINQ